MTGYPWPRFYDCPDCGNRTPYGEDCDHTPDECKVCGVELGLGLNKVQKAVGLPDVRLGCAQFADFSGAEGDYSGDRVCANCGASADSLAPRCSGQGSDFLQQAHVLVDVADAARRIA